MQASAFESNNLCHSYSEDYSKLLGKGFVVMIMSQSEVASYMHSLG